MTPQENYGVFILFTLIAVLVIFCGGFAVTLIIPVAWHYAFGGTSKPSPNSVARPRTRIAQE